jgi:hypothetical protein
MRESRLRCNEGGGGGGNIMNPRQRHAEIKACAKRSSADT